ncbi:hypothetical protein AC579_2685 [Pseudocercospora musae]|uniref:Cytochrome P450 n=1 Tax=Pseudocercospora musae TaxID=113226 RepID=A0A139IV75_9PEZI|nr:hypothetical protein AC579_2685 [Pseudocercospora musae]
MDIITNHPVAAIALAVWILTALASFISPSRTKLPDIPWMGKNGNWPGAEYLATWSAFASMRKWYSEGYKKYGKQGQAYILPDVLGGKHVVLPNEQLAWILEKPDSVLSTGAAHYDGLAGDYAFTDSDILRDLYHEHVVHQNMARKVGEVIPRTWQGICDAFDELWGKDMQQWRKVNVLDSMTHLVASVSNYFFVGEPLCKDKQFLRAGRAFADAVISCLFFNQLLPNVAKPLIMPIVAIPNHWHHWKVAKAVLPFFHKRMVEMEEAESKPGSSIEIPEDYITWHIRTARREGRFDMLQPYKVTRSLMAIEFAANHTTLLTISAALIDLFGSDPQLGYVEGLREEAERVYREHDGVWSKQAVNKLVRADSALRESMRLLNITYSVTRKVLAPEGVRTPDGILVPYGQYISVASEERHYDGDVYANPHVYDAFRFSRGREAYEAANPEDKNSKEYLKHQSQSFVTTSQDFLPFGHGRHACPGRFFIQQELKMLFAYMLMNYDVQHLPERPPNFVWGPIHTPPPKTTLQVRRKAGTV